MTLPSLIGERLQRRGSQWPADLPPPFKGCESETEQAARPGWQFHAGPTR